jgi:hypothetical protein
MRAARLGDDIDDFCVKCKRVMNHSVVSILKDEPAKVRCRTCHSDHDFRHEQAPPPKVDPRKAALFNQVLEKVTGVPAPAADSEKAEPVSEAVEPEPELPSVAASAAAAEETPAPAAEKTKGRRKARA